MSDETMPVAFDVDGTEHEIRYAMRQIGYADERITAHPAARDALARAHQALRDALAMLRPVVVPDDETDEVPVAE